MGFSIKQHLHTGKKIEILSYRIMRDKNKNARKYNICGHFG